MKPYERTEPKQDFPPGPWSSEPNQKEWTDIETNYECAIIRHSRCGHLCGYVKVLDGHPLAKKTYNDQVQIPVGWISTITASIGIDNKNNLAPMDLLIFVHGGLTYGPGDGWFGFDCAHVDDIIPTDSFERADAVYRNFHFVELECTRLAKQLWEYANLAQF